MNWERLPNYKKGINKAIVLFLYYGDPIAVKVYGLLQDAGYCVHLDSDRNQGFTLTIGLKCGPKNKVDSATEL